MVLPSVLPSPVGQVWNMPASIPDNKAMSGKLLKVECGILRSLMRAVLFRCF